jgi:hypothetical protein
MFIFGNDEEQAHRKEDLEKVAKLDAETLAHHLEYGLISTDILLESYEVVDSFTTGEAIMYTAIGKLRTITENALYWIQKNNGQTPTINTVTTVDANEDNQL